MTNAAPKQEHITELVDVLRAVRRLLALPQNDFTWSSWKSAEDALAEIDDLIVKLEQSTIPSHLSVSILFAPTGPIQEVSLSSEWGQDFLAIAAQFDQVEMKIWSR